MKNKPILRRETTFSDVNPSSGPPIILKTPGVFDRTGGRTIPIRARMGLRFGKLGGRGTYRARIGDGVKSEKGGPGGGVPGQGFRGLEDSDCLIIFRDGSGEIFYEKFLEKIR
jgi:hypothetical protein